MAPAMLSSPPRMMTASTVSAALPSAGDRLVIEATTMPAMAPTRPAKIQVRRCMARTSMPST